MLQRSLVLVFLLSFTSILIFTDLMYSALDIFYSFFFSFKDEASFSCMVVFVTECAIFLYAIALVLDVCIGFLHVLRFEIWIFYETFFYRMALFFTVGAFYRSIPVAVVALVFISVFSNSIDIFLFFLIDLVN